MKKQGSQRQYRHEKTDVEQCSLTRHWLVLASGEESNKLAEKTYSENEVPDISPEMTGQKTDSTYMQLTVDSMQNRVYSLAYFSQIRHYFTHGICLSPFVINRIFLWLSLTDLLLVSRPMSGRCLG